LVGTFTCYEDIERYESGIYMGDEIILDGSGQAGDVSKRGHRVKKS
jgi:hypothetical protein